MSDKKAPSPERATKDADDLDVSIIVGDEDREDDRLGGSDEDTTLTGSDDLDLDELALPLPNDAPLRKLPSYQLPAMPDTLAMADPLTAYLARLRHIAPMTAEEQQQLAEAYFEDDNLDAARSLIMSNLRLVVKIAREYHRRRTNLMELVQEGNVGLAEAIRRYDPYRGVKFTSYAQYWIRAMILNYLMNVMQLIKVGSTRSGRKLFYNLRKAREELIQQGFLSPTTLQLAEHLDVSESEVIDVSRVLDQPALSFDAPAPGYEDGSLGSYVADPNTESPEQIIEDLDIRRRIRTAINAFRETLADDRERAIWDERIAADDPLSLQELGDKFSVSRERIRQIEKSMKERFKAFWIHEVGDEESALIIFDE